MCKILGKLTSQYRWFALVYIIGMFFVLPGIFVGLTFIDSQGIAMYTFLGIFIFIATLIGLLKFIQSKESLRYYLPDILHNFEFLPKPLRSLAPYDKILTSLPCCQKCSGNSGDEEAMTTVVIDKSPGKIGATNPTFSMLDEKVY